MSVIVGNKKIKTRNMRVLRPILCLILLSFLYSCNQHKTYLIATAEKGTTYHEVGKSLEDIFEYNAGINLEVLSAPGLGPFKNCQLLWQGQVDFGVASNDTKVTDFLKPGMSINESRIRTILPLYPEILFIIYPDSIQPSSLQDLVKGKRIGVGPEKSGTSIFFKIFLDHNGINPDSYEFVHVPWSKNIVSQDIDISVTVAGYNASIIHQMINSDKCKLFSIDNPDLYKNGSTVEGFCMNYPMARPFIIPKYAFSKGPEKPILTLAIDAMLLCRKDIPKHEIYDIVTEIYRQKNILAEKNTLFNSLTENFDLNSLNFPLHEGSRMYLERNEPSLVERYSRFIGQLIYITLAIAGLGGAMVKVKNNFKKEGLEKYYQQIISIEDEISDNQLSISESRKDLDKIKQKVVKLYIAGRLKRSEDYQVFQQYIDNVILSLEIKSLKKK